MLNNQKNGGRLGIFGLKQARKHQIRVPLRKRSKREGPVQEARADLGPWGLLIRVLGGGKISRKNLYNENEKNWLSLLAHSRSENDLRRMINQSK